MVFSSPAAKFSDGRRICSCTAVITGAVLNREWSAGTPLRVTTICIPGSFVYAKSYQVKLGIPVGRHARDAKKLGHHISELSKKTMQWH